MPSLVSQVLLAVVYNAYTTHIEEIVIEKLLARRRSISVAYDCIISSSGDCTLHDMKLMFAELRKNQHFSHVDDERVDLLFTALDDDANAVLSCEEFLDIVEVLQLKFEFEFENQSPVERFFPHFFGTPFWQSIVRYVRSPLFERHIDAVMVANVAVVLFETTLDLRHRDTPGTILLFAVVEIAFGLVYILEMILKVASQGWNLYWRNMGNRFDFVVTVSLLFGAVYVINPYTTNDQQVIRYLVLLRCLRLFALLAGNQRFRRLVNVFLVLIPASVPLFSLFFLSVYVYAAAGTSLFGGLIYNGNKDLDPELYPLVDAYIQNDYWDLNFNDMSAAWLTLFFSVIVGYLTEIAEAIAATSSYGRWTVWFFISCFVVNSLIVSNVVIAFVVDLFVATDDGLDDQADNDQLRLAQLQGRYGSKRVRVLKANVTTSHEVFVTMFKERVSEIFDTGLARGGSLGELLDEEARARAD